MIAKVREYDLDKVRTDFTDIIRILNVQDNLSIVAKMKEIVPEFKSKNSLFEKLD
jgi:hypothetical protein